MAISCYSALDTSQSSWWLHSAQEAGKDSVLGESARGIRSMTANDLLSTARQIIGYIGMALAAVALAKFAGLNVPMRGSVGDCALVAIACLMVK